MKNQSFLLVLAVILLASVFVGGILIFTRGAAVPQTTTTQRSPGTQQSESSPTPTPVKQKDSNNKEPSEELFTATLADQVGGERSGRVTVFVDAFTGDTKYKVAVANLAQPESPASYQVWAQTKEGIMANLGEITIGPDGTGLLETLGSKPDVGWGVVVTYQEDENPIPGKRILLGSLK